MCVCTYELNLSDFTELFMYLRRFVMQKIEVFKKEIKYITFILQLKLLEGI